MTRAIITTLEWLIGQLCDLLAWLDRDDDAEEAHRVAVIESARRDWGVRVDDDATPDEVIEAVAQSIRWCVMPMGRA